MASNFLCPFEPGTSKPLGIQKFKLDGSGKTIQDKLSPDPIDGHKKSKEKSTKQKILKPIVKNQKKYNLGSNNYMSDVSAAAEFLTQRRHVKATVLTDPYLKPIPTLSQNLLLQKIIPYLSKIISPLLITTQPLLPPCHPIGGAEFLTQRRHVKATVLTDPYLKPIPTLFKNLLLQKSIPYLSKIISLLLITTQPLLPPRHTIGGAVCGEHQ